MASKTYVVKKDGEVLKTYRSLPSAKQLAEKKMANVYCDGICIYKVVPEDGDASPAEPVEAAGDTPARQDREDSAEKAEENPSAKFRLTALMNVRAEPSFDSRIVRTLPAGTTVDVETASDDWLHLTDGTFIYYNGGKFAERE